MEIDFIGKRHSESFFSTSSLILQFFFLYNWLNLYYIVAQVVSCCLDSFFHKAFNWSLPACLHDPLNPQCCSSHSKYFKSSSFLHEFEWKKHFILSCWNVMLSFDFLFLFFFRGWTLDYDYYFNNIHFQFIFSFHSFILMFLMCLCGQRRFFFYLHHHHLSSY